MTVDRKSAAHGEALQGPSGLGFWAMGVGVGLALTLVVGMFVLLVVTTESPMIEASEPVVGSGAIESGSNPTELSFIATEFAFDPDTAESSGEVTITLDNQGLIVHNLEIEGVSGFVVEAQAGEVSVGSVSLAQGTYAYFCSIPGHRDAGMEGVLEVTS